MTNHLKPDSFGHDRALSYDQSNGFMVPINNNLLYLIAAILRDCPINAKILSVGCGTGTEIIALAKTYPDWTFVGVDPSEAMLKVCRERLLEEGFLQRCELIHGVVHDLPPGTKFDAALCLLVGHHVSLDDQRKLVAGIASRLLQDGSFIHSELSYDESDQQTDDLIEKWKALFRFCGTPEEKVQRIPKVFQEHLSILAPGEIEKLISENGFTKPIQFFQSLLIRAWYMTKKSPQ